MSLLTWLFGKKKQPINSSYHTPFPPPIPLSRQHNPPITSLDSSTRPITLDSSKRPVTLDSTHTHSVTPPPGYNPHSSNQVQKTTVIDETVYEDDDDIILPTILATDILLDLATPQQVIIEPTMNQFQGFGDGSGGEGGGAVGSWVDTQPSPDSQPDYEPDNQQQDTYQDNSSSDSGSNSDY